MQTICTSLQADNHTNTPSLNSYRPDALPDTKPTLSAVIYLIGNNDNDRLTAFDPGQPG